jgi:helix-turn-helix protein
MLTFLKNQFGPNDDSESNEGTSRMAEEKTLIKNSYLKFIYELSDLKDKKNEKRLTSGFLTLTTKQIILFPEKDNKPDEANKQTLTFDQITDVDRKVELWRKALGSTTIIPIHYLVNNSEEKACLISTSHENAEKIKKFLCVLLTNGKTVEFVSPFSKGGKILLDKKPVEGNIYIKKTDLILSAEWLGKKQMETIDLLNLDDFEINLQEKDDSSVTLKYQKEGTIISTLITAERKLVSFMGSYIQLISDKKATATESIELNEQQFMLVQMMYTSDIDGEMAIEMLGISEEELQGIVNDLLEKEVLKVSGEEEYELTEKGTKHIVEQMKKNVG